MTNLQAEKNIQAIKMRNLYMKQSLGKKILRFILHKLKLNIRYQLTPGISLLGFNIFFDCRSGSKKFRSIDALYYAIKLRPTTVLDVGSGGGYHANEFKKNGSNVTCIDYGTSVYATESKIDGLNIIATDFNSFTPIHKYELVWASHILEHQRNIGIFIERLIVCCADHGHICITLPDPHRNIWGGHLSIWSPGLLAYNIVLCGVDLSSSIFIRGDNEFSLLFQPIKFTLPSDLTYDKGDLLKLEPYLPQHLSENTDPWSILYI